MKLAPVRRLTGSAMCCVEDSQEQSIQKKFASLIKSTGRSMDAPEGRRVHQMIASSGKLDRFLSNLLIEMYGKLGSIDEARELFDSMHHRNVYSWTIMLNAFVHNGFPNEGLKLFHRMDLEGEKNLDECTYLGALGAASALRDLEQGRTLHRRILESSSVDVGLIVGSSLVNMYCKCGSLEEAREVFSRMHLRNVVSWTCLIAAHIENRSFREALGFFREMQLEGIKPDKLVFASAIEACGMVGRSPEGASIHECVRLLGLDSDPYLRNALITMYGKWGDLPLARQVFFDSFLECNVVSWTALISAYTLHGHSREGVKLFHRMNLEGVKPDKVAFVAILDAAANAACKDQASFIHDSIKSLELEGDTVVGNSLINLYGKCGRVEEARAVFESLHHRDVISWGSLLTAFSQNGHHEQVLRHFNLMDSEGIKPDALVFITVVDACTSLSRLATGRVLHDRITRSGLGHHNDLRNSLLNMFSKCGRLDVAEEIFYKLEHRDTVAWNSVVISFAQHGDWPRAGKLYREMQLEGIKPSTVTLISVLSACRHAGLLEQAREYFTSMVWDHGIAPNSDHYGCLIDLLGKAGWLQHAEELVELMPVHPAITSWTALLGACRIHGDVDRASHAAGHAVGLDPESIAGFVLLSNSFTGTGEI